MKYTYYDARFGRERVMERARATKDGKIRIVFTHDTACASQPDVVIVSRQEYSTNRRSPVRVTRGPGGVVTSYTPL